MRIDSRLEEIAGDMRALVSPALRSEIEGLTASYGRKSRIIRVEPQGENSYVFNSMDFDPEALERLRASDASESDYERAATRTAVYWSEHVPDGLKHLLE
jgi:hypothetical protein